MRLFHKVGETHSTNIVGPSTFNHTDDFLNGLDKTQTVFWLKLKHLFIHVHVRIIRNVVLNASKTEKLPGVASDTQTLNWQATVKLCQEMKGDVGYMHQMSHSAQPLFDTWLYFNQPA